MARGIWSVWPSESDSTTGPFFVSTGRPLIRVGPSTAWTVRRSDERVLSQVQESSDAAMVTRQPVMLSVGSATTIVALQKAVWVEAATATSQPGRIAASSGDGRTVTESVAVAVTSARAFA